MYPGIPPEFVDWDEIVKTSWVANFTKVQVTLARLTASVLDDSADAAYNAQLEMTGDPEDARLARKNKNLQDTLSRLPG